MGGTEGKTWTWANRISGNVKSSGNIRKGLGWWAKYSRFERVFCWIKGGEQFGGWFRSRRCNELIREGIKGEEGE